MYSRINLSMHGSIKRIYSGETCRESYLLASPARGQDTWSNGFFVTFTSTVSISRELMYVLYLTIHKGY